MIFSVPSPQPAYFPIAPPAIIIVVLSKDQTANNDGAARLGSTSSQSQRNRSITSEIKSRRARSVEHDCVLVGRYLNLAYRTTPLSSGSPVGNSTRRHTQCRAISGMLIAYLFFNCAFIWIFILEHTRRKYFRIFRCSILCHITIGPVDRLIFFSNDNTFLYHCELRGRH